MGRMFTYMYVFCVGPNRKEHINMTHAHYIVHMYIHVCIISLTFNHLNVYSVMYEPIFPPFIKMGPGDEASQTLTHHVCMLPQEIHVHVHVYVSFIAFKEKEKCYDDHNVDKNTSSCFG